ncbi:hypothetical protein SKAU_G00018990 [Synaphobranchus kaupii]|uniref:Gypsy retrotransposon integrase-like protein 1 n=1 Tax=Synaphobranchus kaupii TaxID=118154 RepID=A0A9Q1GBF4_SYNKA|nr:hypothetical protein SKAU_G00018990 [Synaphobranchus kaupii]
MVVSLNAIFLYLSQGTCEKDVCKKLRRSIRLASEKFCLRGDSLYYGDRRVILTEEEKVAVLTEVHAGHFGPRRMQEKIAPRFYWRGITQDTLDWVCTCPDCQYFEKLKTEAPELKPIKPVSPWHMVGVDRFGPMLKSTKGNRYCLTLTDYFTKWVEARTFAKKTAANVKEALRDIFTHGLPEIILTDQGSEFKKETDNNGVIQKVIILSLSMSWILSVLHWS